MLSKKKKTFSAFHLFFDCTLIKDWENQTTRNIRIENTFKHNSSQYHYSWIMNWCIWKTYYQIINKKTTLQVAHFKYKYLLKENEYIHLILLSTLENKKNSISIINQTIDKKIYFKSTRNN